jgi:predicted transcriptional regulator
MDPTSQIKKNLISRIQNSNDINFLKALKTIIDSSEEALIQLTQEQQSSIENGRKQIKNGDFIENDKLISELKEWLIKK